MELGISLWLEPNLDQEPTPNPLYTCSSSSFSKKIILNLFIGLGIDMLLVWDKKDEVYIRHVWTMQFIFLSFHV